MKSMCQLSVCQIDNINFNEKEWMYFSHILHDVMSVRHYDVIVQSVRQTGQAARGQVQPVTSDK